MAMATPRVTTTFSESNPALRGLVVLVIYGVGARRLALGNSESEVRDC